MEKMMSGIVEKMNRIDVEDQTRIENSVGGNLEREGKMKKEGNWKKEANSK
jgi:hypothetical protein